MSKMGHILGGEARARLGALLDEGNYNHLKRALPGLIEGLEVLCSNGAPLDGVIAYAKEEAGPVFATLGATIEGAARHIWATRTVAVEETETETETTDTQQQQQGER